MRSSNTSHAISVENLTKTYRIEQRRQDRFGWLRSFLFPKWETLTAVDAVSFEIEPGQIAGFLGPNGAGKSTTIKILTGVLHPDGGRVRVVGRVPHDHRIANAQDIGVLFGHRSHLIFELPPIDAFRFLRRVYGLSDQEFESRLERLVELLDLEPLLHQSVRTLSLGQRMRCEVAATFLHKPKVAYLDEPTIGLDVQAKQSVREFLDRITKEEGATVVLATHDLADIERLCERVIVIDHGRIVFDGALRKLIADHATGRSLTAEIRPGSTEAISSLVRGHHRRASISTEGVELNVEGLPNAEVAADVARTLSGDPNVIRLTVKEPRVEEVIASVFRHGVRSPKDD